MSTAPSTAEVRQLQVLLNTMGLGMNIPVSGVVDASTNAAVEAMRSALGTPAGALTFSEVLALAKQALSTGRLPASPGPLAAAQQQGGTSVTLTSPNLAATVVPFYKKPIVLAGVAAAGLVAYIMWRTSSKSEGPAAPVSGVEKRSHHKKAEKCGRTPDVDFAGGEPLEGVES